jgi:hypothetical protein
MKNPEKENKQSPPESMEERFEDRLGELVCTCYDLEVEDNARYHFVLHGDRIKDFIRAEISRAKQDFLKEILPEKREETITKFIGHGVLEGHEWNACIDEILSRSKKILK